MIKTITNLINPKVIKEDFKTIKQGEKSFCPTCSLNLKNIEFSRQRNFYRLILIILILLLIIKIVEVIK